MEPDHMGKRFRRKRFAALNETLTGHSRAKRASPHVIYPEILVIVDYDGYRLHGGDNVQVSHNWDSLELGWKLISISPCRSNDTLSHSGTVLIFATDYSRDLKSVSVLPVSSFQGWVIRKNVNPLYWIILQPCTTTKPFRGEKKLELDSKTHIVREKKSFHIKRWKKNNQYH